MPTRERERGERERERERGHGSTMAETRFTLIWKNGTTDERKETNAAVRRIGGLKLARSISN